MPLAQQFVSALTDSDTIQREAQLGMLRIEDSRMFKYVKFSGTTAVAAGDPVCYVITDTTFQTVDQANSVNGAGVAMAAQASGAVRYGWIQIRGLSQPITTLTSGTAGQPVASNGAANGALKVVAAVTDQAVGWVANAAAKTIMLNYPWC